MKDYYQILNVTPESSESEIRKSYRKLAMEFHPDHNPDKPDAEEKFKEIAEAYGVLTDPVKRQQYDTARAMGADRFHPGQSDGFNYSQEDILRDLFQDPRFQQMFQSMLLEFQRHGFQASEQFMHKSFFGNRRGVFFSGLIFFGSLAGPSLLRSRRAGQKSLPGKKSLLRSLGRAVGSVLSGQGRQDTKTLQYTGKQQQDTNYNACLSTEELKKGKEIQLVTRGAKGQERLKVRIPPNSKAGQKLRLRGKGLPGPEGRGDLYLTLQEQ